MKMQKWIPNGNYVYDLSKAARKYSITYNAFSQLIVYNIEGRCLVYFRIKYV